MVIGIIGLGDVGSRYASGITKEGAITKGYDLLFGVTAFKEKEDRCRDAGVNLVCGTQELIEGSDLILAITTCAQAIETAEGAAPFLKKGQIYIDFNSAVPTIKFQLQKIIESKGVDFCDACTMESPIKAWHKTPVVISGPRAKEVSEILNSYNMNLRYLGDKIGQASALKILRSIFTKGLEALLIESLSSSYAYGVMDDVFESINTMLKEPTEILFSRMIRTNVVHSKRRAEEIGAIADMLKEVNMDNTMSVAAYKKLMWSADSGIKEQFRSQIPENLYDAIDAFSKLKT